MTRTVWIVAWERFKDEIVAQVFYSEAAAERFKSEDLQGRKGFKIAKVELEAEE